MIIFGFYRISLEFLKQSKVVGHTAMGNEAWMHNWTNGGRQLYTEIREDSTKDIWLCQVPMTPQEFQQLPLKKGFSRVAIGRAAHDRAYFCRSPDAQEDGPVMTMRVGDWTYSKVARPGSLEKKYMEEGYRDFILLTVFKYHKVMFKVGRTIEILTMGDGQGYVPNVTELSGMFNKPTKERVLPKGWAIRKETLHRDLIVEIPCPARVCFFKSGHGFHGPVEF